MPDIGSHVSNGFNNAQSARTTTGISTLGGSTLVVCLSWDIGVNFTSIADSASNSWTIIGTELSTASMKNRMYYAPNITPSASHTVTFTASGNAFISMWVVELRGVATAPLDTSAAQTDNTSPFVSTTATNTEANAVLVGHIGANVSGTTPPVIYTPGNSFTSQEQIQDFTSFYTGAVATKIVTASASQEASFTADQTLIDSIVRLAIFTASGKIYHRTGRGILSGVLRGGR